MNNLVADLVSVGKAYNCIVKSIMNVVKTV